jgi:membrane protease subunit (stomatin/prohibitin family)
MILQKNSSRHNSLQSKKRESVMTNETPPNMLRSVSTSEALANILKNVGYIVIVLGFIAAAVVLSKLSEAGMFSRGGVNAAAVIAAVIVAFYHFMFGVLCIGVSTLLEQKTTGMAAGSNANSPIKCAKCGKEYPSKYSGKFCEECGCTL